MGERPRHLVLSLVCGGIAVGMVGAAYAAVPFYRAFCQATGFDGTVRRGSGPIGEALDKTLTVRFDTNVRGLPWVFRPEVPSQTIRIGAPSMAWFKIRNDGDVPITGRALYNVTPESAAAYFIKTQCFCFSDQTIPAHTEMRFPVIYYVQPGYVKDRDARVFEEITLSYTYYPSTRNAQAAPQVVPAQPVKGAVTQTAATRPREALGGTPSRGL
jgi:cytochrome c oxidase assembly protein subunit 11